MNKKLINWWAGGPSYPNLTAIMLRWTALGYTHPSPAVLSSLNTLIGDLIAAGVWTGFDAFWCMMLNNSGIVSTTGAINLRSLSANQMTFPVAPNYTASGIEGNASNMYALTNFNPITHGVNYTLNAASRGLYKYKAGTATDYMEGHASSGADLITEAGSSTLQRINGTGGNMGDTRPIEYYAINRVDASNIFCMNGTAKIDIAAAASGVANENFTLLRAAFGYGSMGIGAYFIGRSFSEAEHLLIRTAMLAHKTRLGL